MLIFHVMMHESATHATWIAFIAINFCLAYKNFPSFSFVFVVARGEIDVCGKAICTKCTTAESFFKSFLSSTAHVALINFPSIFSWYKKIHRIYLFFLLAKAFDLRFFFFVFFFLFVIKCFLDYWTRQQWLKSDYGII